MDKKITEIIEEVAAEICERYCKYPDTWNEEKEGCELSDSMCAQSWANNNGEMWCWKHPNEVPNGACETCPNRERPAEDVRVYSYRREVRNDHN